MLSHQGPTVWEKSSSSLHRKKLSQRMGMNSVMEGEEPWLFTRFLDLTGTVQKIGVPEALQIGFLIGWNDLSAVLLLCSACGSQQVQTPNCSRNMNLDMALGSVLARVSPWS